MELFLQAYERPPEPIVLDLEATDNPLSDDPLRRFFHGYYKAYGYLLRYLLCGEHLLCAKRRPADREASAGSVRHLDRIVSPHRLAAYAGQT